MPATTDPTAALPALSLTEWVVLAVLAESPSHGFAIAKQLRSDTDLGRIITIHRPLVYRALARVVALGLAEPRSTEPSDAGPARVVHRITRRGARAVEGWLDQPVAHIRDLRIEFLAKVRLNQRRDRTIAPLVAAQQTALATTLDHLTNDEPADIVGSWRHHNATAARDFLARLAR